MMRQRCCQYVALLLSALAMVSSAQAAPWAPYLVTIGYDQVQTHFSTLTGTGQTVAVLDTGIDANHISFTGKTIFGINENTTDLAPTAPPDFADGNGHGSFVASVAAGVHVTVIDQNNAERDVSGIAPGADILAVRVLDNSGSGSFSVINTGLSDIVTLALLPGNPFNIRVVNLSLGTTAVFPTVPSDPLVTEFNGYVQTLKNLGIPVVVASGNSGSHTGLSFPAILGDVISVGSTNEAGSAISSFSNRNDSLDILAPGESIIGAYANTTSGTGNLDNLYAIGAGTSFATPQVAGSILLINELYFNIHGQYPTVDQLLAYLTQSGQPSIFDANPPDGGGGAYPLLNIYHALQAVPEPISLVLLTPAMLVLLTVRPRRALPPLAA